MVLAGSVALFMGCAGDGVTETDMLRDDANANTLFLMGGGPGGTYGQIASDIAYVIDEKNDLRVIAMTGRGSQQAMEDAILLDQADVVMMSPHVRDYYESNNFLPSIDLNRLQYIMPLYPEEAHILAREGINSVLDLEGRRVSFGSASSGGFVTATLMFRDLGIQVEVLNLSHGAGVDALLSREIDAVIREVGQPNSLYSGIPEGTGIHFLSITPDQLNTPSYSATTIRADSYPNLVPAGTEVPTISSVGAFVVYVPEAGDPRKERIDRFVESLLADFATFQDGSTYHPKWGEMDPSLEIGGWTRYEAAAQFLAR